MSSDSSSEGSASSAYSADAQLGHHLKLKLGKPAFSQQALAIVLIFWALALLNVFTFDGVDTILAVGALVTGALLLLDK